MINFSINKLYNQPMYMYGKNGVSMFWYFLTN